MGQQMMMPGQPMMPGMPMPMPMGAPVMAVPVVSAHRGADIFSTLQSLPGLFISQNMQLLEAVVGFEQSNRYRVSGWNPIAGAEKPKNGVFTEEVR